MRLEGMLSASSMSFYPPLPSFSIFPRFTLIEQCLALLYVAVSLWLMHPSRFTSRIRLALLHAPISLCFMHPSRFTSRIHLALLHVSIPLSFTWLLFRKSCVIRHAYQRLGPSTYRPTSILSRQSNSEVRRSYPIKFPLQEIRRQTPLAGILAKMAADARFRYRGGRAPQEEHARDTFVYTWDTYRDG